VDQYRAWASEYLDMARGLFAGMAAGWDDACGGGLWWTRRRTYKNAIPNELFLLIAGRLHQRPAGATVGGYLDWALREWQWFSVRHLYELYRHRPRAGYRDFILANATSLWRNSRNRRNQVGLAWTGPFDRADAVRQGSALDVLNAAVGVTDPAASGPAY
jgi:predicted alpha-1,6-mannanase (GH76 family)